MGLPVLGSVIDLAKSILERVIPDPKVKQEALQKLAELEQSGDLAVIAGQVEINKIEASSDDKFQRRWRPAVGWIGALALFIQMVVRPVAVWIAMLSGHPVDFPVMETELLYTLLASMLGFGGLRTYEKLNVRK